MRAEIEIEEVSVGAFQVRVIEGKSESTHRVTVKPEDYKRLTSGSSVTMEELVRRSFEFLLEHEPKESILPRFDLREIGRYFPQFESEIKGRLSRA